MWGAGDRLEPVPARSRNPGRREIDSRMSQGVITFTTHKGLL